MPSNKFGSLSVGELKVKLQNIWRKHEKLCRTQMAPLLYNLRFKLKAQGKTGAGFGAWVEDTLDISRRTADRWADDWAIAQGLKKPSKCAKPKAFRQMSKSAQSNPDGKVTVPLSFILPEKEAEKFIAAMQLLGDKATSIIYDAILTAARSRKKPAQPAATPKRKLAFLNDGEDSTLLASTEARAKGVGQ